MTRLYVFILTVIIATGIFSEPMEIEQPEFTKPVAIKEVQPDARDVQCLADNLYHEARGEGHDGMVAVAHVVRNRMKDGRWPSDVCSVVYQKGQFSWTAEMPVVEESQAYLHAREIATNFLTRIDEQIDVTNGALFYHANHLKLKWRERTAQIGNHIFFRKTSNAG